MMNVFMPLLLSMLLPSFQAEQARDGQCRAELRVDVLEDVSLRLDAPPWDVERAVRAWVSQAPLHAGLSPDQHGWLVLPLPMESKGAAVVGRDAAWAKGALVGGAAGAGLLAMSWWLSMSLEAPCQAEQELLPAYPELASAPADAPCAWCDMFELEPLAHDSAISRMYDRSVDPSQVQPRAFGAGWAALSDGDGAATQGRYAVRRGATAEAAGSTTGLGVATPSLGDSGQRRSKVAR